MAERVALFPSCSYSADITNQTIASLPRNRHNFKMLELLKRALWADMSLHQTWERLCLLYTRCPVAGILVEDSVARHRLCPAG